MTVADEQQPIGSGFGKDTPASEVIAGIDLSGKVAIVTGGYSGIGVETVRALTGAGAKVIVPARNREKAQAALADVAGDVTIADMDLADIASVRAFADAMIELLPRLDILINNAGIMATPLNRVGPGWEGQFGTNHLGHFELTRRLMPLLEKAAAPRVVAVSSLGHARSDIRWDDPHFTNDDYDPWEAYGQAKTANALFAVALDKRLQAHGGHAFSVHPGVILTDLGRYIPKDQWEQTINDPTFKERTKSTEAGAATSIFGATSPRLADKGGVYLADGDVGQLDTGEQISDIGVRPHAVDEDSAERLWKMSEDMLASA